MLWQVRSVLTPIGFGKRGIGERRDVEGGELGACQTIKDFKGDKWVNEQEDAEGILAAKKIMTVTFKEATVNIKALKIRERERLFICF